MATHISIRHTFDCDVDTFWDRIFFNDDFNKSLYLDYLDFEGYEVLEQTDEGNGVVHRKVRQTPKSDAPAAVKKVIGEGVSYVEDGRFDPAGKRWRFEVIPSKMADKISISGEFWVEPKGDKQVERICTIDMAVKIFGVGKVIEGFIEKQTRHSYDKAAEYTQKYIREQNL